MTGAGPAHPLPPRNKERAIQAIQRPDIFPLDCIVLGNVSYLLKESVGSEPTEPSRRALHFWGYSRNTEDLTADNTKLCFLDHYEPTSSSSHGASDNPVWNKLRLQYLGLRTENIPEIWAYFREHFKLKVMDSANLAFTTSGGQYRPVLTRWPDSHWYFLRPTGEEGTASKVTRDNVWHAWSLAP